MISAQPMDGVVLLGGCDKTVPAQLMGAVSADRPAICLVAGPMITGDYQGERPWGRAPTAVDSGVNIALDV